MMSCWSVSLRTPDRVGRQTNAYHSNEVGWAFRLVRLATSDVQKERPFMKLMARVIRRGRRTGTREERGDLAIHRRTLI